MTGNRSNNKLWEGHRMILPEMRERATSKCRDCKFLVSIAGRKEKRWGCVVGIKKYSLFNHRIPEVLDAIEIIRLVGIEGLQEAVDGGNPTKHACEFFSHS